MTTAGPSSLLGELVVECSHIFRDVGTLTPQMTLGDALIDEYSRVALAIYVEDHWASIPGEALAPAITLAELDRMILERAATESEPRRWYRCRTVNPDDIGLLYAWVRPDRGRVWRRRRPPHDPGEFTATAYRGVLTEVIAETIDGQPLAWLAIYDAEFPTGVAWFDVVLAPGTLERHPCVLAHVRVFADDVLHNWPLRQLYFELDDWCFRPFSTADNVAFRVEARLRGHRFYAGARHDVYHCVHPR